jgi:Ger(x)C family germination protein
MKGGEILLTDMGGLVRNKVFKRWVGCMFTLAISMCLSGCWDRHELQERDFVLAVAIDRADEGMVPGQGEKTAQVEEFVQPHGSKRYRLSLQILQLNPSNNSEGASKGSTSTSVISTIGESMLEMLWDLQGQSERELWFDHVQTIIISDAAVRQGGLGPMFDFYHRNGQIRWLTKVVITDGEARALLDYKPPSGESSGMFIANSLRMYEKNSHVHGWHTDLGDISTSRDNQRKVLIPRIELVDDVVKLGGMAIFKKEQFIDYVDEYVTQGFKLMNGIDKSSVITFECPKHSGKIVAFQMVTHDTKLTPHVDNGAIYFTLEIAMTGNLGEVQCGLQHDTVEAKEVGTLEALTAEAVKKNILYSFHTYQRLKVDASIFGQTLAAFDPLEWQKVKDRWDDEVFSNLSLIVSVNVSIESVGNHK